MQPLMLLLIIARTTRFEVMAWVQERLRFTRQQKKQLAWLWRTYNDKMQSLMPRRQHLMDCVNSADTLTAGLPIHRPGQPATPPMLDPAEALVDHLKLMQVTTCGVPPAGWDRASTEVMFAQLHTQYVLDFARSSLCKCMLKCQGLA